MSGLWNNMKISYRLLLISFAFILPLGVLFYLWIDETNNKIQFSQKEIYGNAYQRPLESLLKWIPLHEQAILFKSAKNSSDETVTRIQDEIDQAFEKLKKADQKYGKILQFTAEGLGKRDRDT